MFKRFVIICMLFFATIIMAKKQALLVGVSDYKGSQNDLVGIDKDIKKMRWLFESWGFEVEILYNEKSRSSFTYASNL